MNSNNQKNLTHLLMALEERLEFFSNNIDLYNVTYTHYIRCFYEGVAKEYFCESPDKNVKDLAKYDLKNKYESIKFKLFLTLVIVVGKNILRLKYKKV